MDIELAKKVVEELTNEGLDASLRESYSGRCMYGRTTAAVVCDSRLAPVYAAGRIAEREGMEWDPDFGMDNMGLGFVIY